jgi:hypothetical protein
MGRKANVDLLPPDIRERLNDLLRDPRMTQLAITSEIQQLLKEGGHSNKIHNSEVNRYAQKMDLVGKKLRQGREISEVWISKLGVEPQGRVGQLLNEVIRNLAFDTALAMSEGDEPAHPKLIRELAMAVERLEKAASDNDKRGQEIASRASEETAKQAEKVATRNGVSPEGIAAIRAAIMQELA